VAYAAHLSRRRTVVTAARPVLYAQILLISPAQLTCRDDARNWLPELRASTWRPDVARKYTRRSADWP
jgi:hypothetical protein